MSGSARSRSRSYVELGAIGLGWLVWSLSRGLSASMWGKPMGEMLPGLLRTSLVGLLLTFGLFQVLHLLTRKRLLTPWTVLGATVVAFAFALLQQVVVVVVDRLATGQTPFQPALLWYLSRALDWFTVYAGLALVFFLVGTIWELEGERRRALQAGVRTREARLQMLRYQLNPDFLFGTLGTIREVLFADRARADRLVTELSDFLRYTLVEEDRLEVRLGQELDTIGNYLAIEQLRLGDRLQASVRADEAARAWIVPAFLVQPLVENAVEHGLRTGPAPLRVSVEASVVDDTLRVEVANSGRLAGHDGNGAPAPGVGLTNVRLHLEHFFPDRHTFALEERAGVVHASLSIRPEHAFAG